MPLTDLEIRRSKPLDKASTLSDGNARLDSGNESTKNYIFVAQLIEHAAIECGDAHTNRKTR
jgi:hypothetical protein